MLPRWPSNVRNARCLGRNRCSTLRFRDGGGRAVEATSHSRCCFTGTLLSRFARARQILCGVDQCDMAERLGKVADKALRRYVVLLREQAKVVAQPEEPVE